MGIFSFLCKKPSYEVFGPQGGISTVLTLPEGFNPASDKCPMVILMHGFMANKNMAPIKGLAKALAKEGIASIRFDFDAHGKSEGQFIKMTIANEIEDARAVIHYVKTFPYVSKIAFAGHSQGGVIAGMLAGELEGSDDKPVCLLQLAPAAVLKDDALAGQCMNARYDAANPPAYVNVFFHKLGRDFILAAQKLPIYETSCCYSGKVCLIHGTKDAIVPVAYSEKYNQGYPDSELHLLEGEGHFMRSKEVLALSCCFLKEQLL